MTGASEQVDTGDLDRSGFSMRVLLVDQERPLVESCVMVVVNEGYRVRTCSKPLEASRIVRREAFDVVLIDADLSQGMAGSIVRACLEFHPKTRVIVMSNASSVEGSIEAFGGGAWSYLAKPFSADHLRILLAKAQHEILAGRVGAGMLTGSPLTKSAGGDPPLLGRSASFMRIIQLSRKVAASSASVLLTGESGSGKEVIAQFIHQNSRRGSKQLVAVNCAALPEMLLESEMFGHVRGAFTGAVRDKAGLLEIADGGTLFLDELTEMPLQLQAKLLRVIQDGKVRRVGAETDHTAVNVRFIASTNRDPAEAIADGRLRRDLYYRLAVVPIHLPALRDRAEDIPQLALHFLQKYWAKYREPGAPIPTFTESALQELRQRPWPGNVRELQNVIEHAAVILEPGSMVEGDALPHMAGAPPHRPNHLEQVFGVGAGLAELTYHDARERVLACFEQAYINALVRQTGDNLSQAARIAGVDRTTLYRLLDKHGLRGPG